MSYDLKMYSCKDCVEFRKPRRRGTRYDMFCKKLNNHYFGLEPCSGIVLRHGKNKELDKIVGLYECEKK